MFDSRLFFVLQPFSVTKHPASHPLTLFPGKLGASERMVEGWVGVDKTTSVSDTNMARSQHQYYVVFPRSLPPTE